MRSLHALVALFVLAFAVVALDACATAQAATRSAHRPNKHRAKPKLATTPTHASSSSSAASGTAVAAREEVDDDSDDADADDDRSDDRGEQDLTALSVSEGGASWYHDSLAGRVTANGEKYDPEIATCAHRSLPFGTVLVIENVATGTKSHCRVNDRGPFVDGRLIDVSKKVARDLGMLGRGVIRVRIRVAKPPTAT